LVYAALWEANRTAWGLTSGGPGSGLYRSEDEGATWKEVKGKGWPEGILGRMGVSVSGADPNRVYVLVEAKKGGLYRSDDGGKHWKLINKDHRFTQRAWYFTHVFADPKSADTVFIMNTGTYRSTDGGHSFSPLSVPHGDNHALWIDPNNPSRMIAGNDGGVTITVDGGKSWTPQDNQPTAQFYHVIADNRFNYYVYGAQQDNSTVGIASRTDHGYIGRQDWYSVGGGESGTIAPDPRDPDIVYAGSYDGLITRYNRHNGQVQAVTPWPDNPMGSGAAGLKYRFQWTMPIVISPHDPDVIYAGGQVLFKSSDRGTDWSVISPDLTRNDKSKQGSSGGPLTEDNTSVEYYDTIFAIAESPVTKGQIWVGSDDGLVHLTRDGGKTWTDVTPKQMPEWSRVDLIEASPSNAATAYLAIDRHKLDDLKPYIYVTHDYGKSWSEITNGIPATSFVHAVREDPVKATLLYAGTETGVFVSFDAGAHWQTLQLNLPPSPVRDLIIKDDDLVAATHGRAFWILDDISPLRQLPGRADQSEVYLFRPRTAYRNHAGGFHPHGPVGQNPPGGAIIYYYLKSAPGPKDEVKLQILDRHGKPVRSYSNKKPKGAGSPLTNEFPGLSGAGDTLPTKAGTNRFAWDLRYKGPDPVPHHISWGGVRGGPMVLPGTYQVKLTAGGKALTEPLVVKLDPRVKTSPQDLEKQLKLAMQIRDRITQAHDAVNAMRALRAQIQGLHTRLGDNAQAKDLLAAADALDKKMKPVEGALIQVKTQSSEDNLNFPIMISGKLGALLGTVVRADQSPTAQSYNVYQLLNEQLDAQLAKWKDIQTKDLAALNALARKNKMALVMIPAKGPAGNP
ncbi:MAG TPA: glycosyl hydrolase, partial [Terriglobia bacterium]|nr:glycosyl hydrolase [Terriglobia bacterium]